MGDGALSIKIIIYNITIMNTNSGNGPTISQGQNAKSNLLKLNRSCQGVWVDMKIFSNRLIISMRSSEIEFATH